MNKLVFFPLLILLCVTAYAQAQKELHVLVAPGTITENSATLLWDKQSGKAGVVYEISLNGKAIASTTKTKTQHIFL
jgi:exo-poly-alpha-galacturonosidase